MTKNLTIIKDNNNIKKNNNEYCSLCNTKFTSTIKDKKVYTKFVFYRNEFAVCDSCIDICYKYIEKLNEKQNIDESLSFKKISPKEIFNYAKEFIIGQDLAIQKLSIGIFLHYMRIKDITLNNKSNMEKFNILCLGPTGAGKTFSIKTICEHLSIPFVNIDCKQLTDKGYIGNDPEIALFKLLENTNFNIPAAQCGIVYLDEIDKLCTPLNSGNPHKDVSGSCVQKCLLKMLEGETYSVQDPSSAQNFMQKPNVYQVNTSNILFIGGGHFESVFGTSSEKAGFIKNNEEEHVFNLPKKIIECGMLPELMGRFSTIVKYNKLRVKDLELILNSPNNSILKSIKAASEYLDKEIYFTKDAIKIISNFAYDLELGARSLKLIVSEICSSIIYKMDSSKEKVFKINSKYLKHFFKLQDSFIELILNE